MAFLLRSRTCINALVFRSRTGFLVRTQYRKMSRGCANGTKMSEETGDVEQCCAVVLHEVERGELFSFEIAVT